MALKLIPFGIRSWFKRKVKNIISETEPPLASLKYIPFNKGGNSYVLPSVKSGERLQREIPVPPPEYMRGLSDSAEEYLEVGKSHTEKMLEVLKDSGFIIDKGKRILDMGCGTGRMIRHLNKYASLNEIWGVDINSSFINWAKQQLDPPFHFAMTTTIPHLPFEDRYFNLIYCGSLFTHIEDLSDAWLCELKRVLAPNGRLYITIHDNHTIHLLETKYKDHWFAKQIASDPVFIKSKNNFGMMVFGRDAFSNVFYDIDHFCSILKSIGLTHLSVTKEAYAYQTAVLVEK